MNDARQCSGHEVHSIEDHHTCLKTHLSELIMTVDSASYDGQD